MANCHRDARSQRPADPRNTNAEAVDDETSRKNSQLNDGTLSSTEGRAGVHLRAGVRLRSGSSALLPASLHLTLHLLERLPRWLKIRIDPQRRLKFWHRLR